MTETMMTNRRVLVLGLTASEALGHYAVAQGLPTIAVTKDPNCGCCEKWVAHLRESRLALMVTEGPVNPLKARLSVPRDLAFCHTAQVGRYVVEGHVTAGAIKRLLAEKPEGTGLAVPGIPKGSPGMGVEDMEADTYDVVLFGPHERRPFASYRGAVLA